VSRLLQKTKERFFSSSLDWTEITSPYCTLGLSRQEAQQLKYYGQIEGEQDGVDTSLEESTRVRLNLRPSGSGDSRLTVRATG
jgi:hypothetical protein